MSRLAPVDAFIAVGSNIEPETRVVQALELLIGFCGAPVEQAASSTRSGDGRQDAHPTRDLHDPADGQLRVLASSTFYRTAPLGRPEQPPFVNGVWRIQTTIEPRPLKFHVLRGIEAALGRVRTEDRYAPRTIDLDVVLYGDAVVEEPGLVLPDPDVRERPFIALPLLELAPDLVLPDTGEQLSAVCPAQRPPDMQPLCELTQTLRARIPHE